MRANSKSKQLSFFELDTVSAVKELAKQDKQLGKLIKKAGPFALERDPMDSVFHQMLRSIVYQQLTGKAAATIYGRFRSLFEEETFPCPLKIGSAEDELLRQAGLSRAKALAVKDLAEKTRLGTIPDLKEIVCLPDEEIIERLTTVRGIGPWSVHMLLIFQLGRPDVLPVSDYGVRKGFALTYGLAELPTPKELTAHAELWRPYRSIASWYMWRAVDLSKAQKNT